MRKVLSLVRFPFRSENRKLKTRRKVYEYERWAEVLWNLDGNSFALTDYAGSDNALCTIIGVDEQILAVPVFENLLIKLSWVSRRKSSATIISTSKQWNG